MSSRTIRCKLKHSPETAFVNPAYTSQVCFSCRQKGLRVKDVFKCTTCGERHADFNAACMISIGGAVVNQPELRV